MYNQQSEKPTETKRKVMNDQMKSKVDIGIIVALREEFRELFSQLPSSRRTFLDSDTGVTDYLFEWGNTVQYRCAATFVGDMGLEKAALATDRFTKRHQPTTIVMLGIAGGIDKDVKLGDVVVVDSATNYLDRGKAVEGTQDTFTFEMGGNSYRCSENLVRAVQDLEFAHYQLYQEWQEEAKKRRESEVALKQWQGEEFRDKPVYINGPIASGPLVVSSESFTQWLKTHNRNFLAVEMEGAGMLSAVYSNADPQRTLILRGISDHADAEKQKLDGIGKGAIRQYAMNNVISLLWKLLEAGVFGNTHQTEVQKEILPEKALLYNEIGRNKLLRVLGRLTPPQFSELIFLLQAPDEYLPHQNAPQIERAIALLNWASTPGGIGLPKIKEVLDELPGFKQ